MAEARGSAINGPRRSFDPHRFFLTRSLFLFTPCLPKSHKLDNEESLSDASEIFPPVTRWIETSEQMARKRMIIPSSRIKRTILLIRGEKVMLGPDLAELYGVATKRLNEQVKRNRERFPEDFMFQLTQEERDEVVAKCDHLRT